MIRSSEILNPEALICAIVKCAVADYKAELQKRKRFTGQIEYADSSVEGFFKSEYFDFLVSKTELKVVRGEDIIEALKKKEARRKAKNRKALRN